MTQLEAYKTVVDKYNDYATNDAKNGDIIQITGTSWLSNTIAWSDKRPGEGVIATHSGLCMMMFDKNTNQIRRFMLQAEANGVMPDYLSDAVCSGVRNFYVLRPKVSQDVIDIAVSKSWTSAEAKIAYDFFLLPKILMYEKMGLKSRIMANPLKDICSMYTGQKYASQFARCFDSALAKNGYVSPQDLRRDASPDEFSILWMQGITG